MNSFSIRSLFMVLIAAGFAVATENVVNEQVEVETMEVEKDKAEPHGSDATEEISSEQVDYAKGSVCGYCTYCKFCKLCDEDCPCETSASKPNCKMCKYCKYCYLCSAVCDTICTPGGILDRVSASLVNSLPTVDHSEVNSDIESVQSWIEKKKDEL